MSEFQIDKLLDLKDGVLRFQNKIKKHFANQKQFEWFTAWVAAAEKETDTRLVTIWLFLRSLSLLTGTYTRSRFPM